MYRDTFRNGGICSFIAIGFTIAAVIGWNAYDPEHIMLLGAGIFTFLALTMFLHGWSMKHRLEKVLEERDHGA